MSEIQLNDPQTLYRRWEESQWSPFDIDLSADREQWPAIDPAVKQIIHFALSSLMVAEERITTKFTGLVAAHGSEEEATFLSTQQVDEARHMQFYARFRDEVIAEPQVIAAHVERAREEVSDSFRHLFDEALVQSHEELVASPGDLAAKVRFVTLYHLVLESTLGLTTFKFVTEYLNAEGLLPGFVEGYSKIHHDETRHIGYGVWFLRETVRDHPETADAVRETLRDLLPAVADSLKPPGDANGSGELLGVTQEEIREFALGGLSSTPQADRRPARDRVQLDGRPDRARPAGPAGSEVLDAGHGRPSVRRQFPAVGRVEGARGRRHVEIVAAHRDRDVTQARAAVVGGIDGNGAQRVLVLRMADEHLHPRVRAPFAEHVTGHVAGGQSAQPAESQHAVRVVLADPDTCRPRLRSRRADLGRTEAVLEVLEDTVADLVGQLDTLQARAAELVGHCEQSVVGAGQPRGLGEALVEGDRVGSVRAVDRGLALDDGPGGELDRALHVLEAEVEDDVPECVVRALGIDVAARDADLVREQALVVVVVRWHDHEPVAKPRDRARILVGEGLLDQDGRLLDVLPVDLIVVDAPQRGDQVAERLTGHPAASGSSVPAVSSASSDTSLAHTVIRRRLAAP